MRIFLSSILGLLLLGGSYAGAVDRDWKNPKKYWTDPVTGYYCVLFNDGSTYCDPADGPD